MRNRGPRVWRKLRIGVKRALRRIDGQTPDWMRWLTPWGTSASRCTHWRLLDPGGFLYFAQRRVESIKVQGDPDYGLVGASSTTTSRRSRTPTEPGDPVHDCCRRHDEAPSLTLDPSQAIPDVTNLPALPPDVLLAAGYRARSQPGSRQPQACLFAQGEGHGGSAGP